MELIVQACNIHSGGGAVLLKDLINSLSNKIETALILDERFNCDLEESEKIKIFRIKPTIFGRLKADLILKRISCESSRILCFGSLPPLHRSSGSVFLFIQNRFIVDKNQLLFNLPVKVILRLLMERLWFRLGLKNADVLIVQTQSMKVALDLQGLHNAVVMPFRNLSELNKKFVNVSKRFDFIYLASGEPHKNHKILIEAWCMLAEFSFYPSLCLTLDPEIDREVCELIARKKIKSCINIINVGRVSNEEGLFFLSQSACLIFPSLVESFGIPLAEATALGIPIIASEEDFVREVAEPIQTFNPRSAVSICRSVLRFRGVKTSREPTVGASVLRDLLLNSDVS